MSYLSRQRTRGGYAGDEVMSALQKEIRRGQERDAYFWAEELASIKPHGKTMLWNRLWCIAHEDIGTADMVVGIYVYTCRKVYEHYKGEGGAAAMALCNAVIALSRAKKTRQADSLVNIVGSGNYRPEIPDYALDKHTVRGRKMGRGVEHWLDVGCVLHNEVEGGDPYEEEARPYFTGEIPSVPFDSAGPVATDTTMDYRNTPNDKEDRSWQQNLGL
ncbi:MAG: hypothetical protein M3Q29_01095 [Chloroflexota bacterium]|nr:hypothetical protein [Chloroflexota bacterium]